MIRFLSLLPGLLALAWVCLVSAAACNAEERSRPVRISVLGDSLTAGYGLSAGRAFPDQLQAALKAEGISVTVFNSGVSGDTTAGGLARLAWTLQDKPHLVIVELGANDALRGLDPEQSRKNLDAIVSRLQALGVKVILAGMKAPRNLGVEYYTKFDSIYPGLARKYSIPLYPFFLEGVAGDPALNLSDGLHPNEKGVAEIVQRILPLVRAALCEMDSGKEICAGQFPGGAELFDREWAKGGPGCGSSRVCCCEASLNGGGA